MKPFKDNAGRTWTVTADVCVVKRFRSLLDINLLEVLEGRLIERLAAQCESGIARWNGGETGRDREGVLSRGA